MGGDTERPQRIEARLTNIESMLKELKEQIGNVTKKIGKLENRATEQTQKIEEIENLCKEVLETKKEIQAVKAENLQMKQKLRELEGKMDNQLIWKKRRMAEIYGINKQPNENQREIIKEIASAAKVIIEDKDIEDCFRPNDSAGRERPISVKFRSAEIRDRFLKETKKAKLRLGQIRRAPENKKLYVNEALIPERKKLLYRVKNESKNREWKAVWTYKGAIYIKISENQNPIRIVSEEELVTLIE